MDQIILLPKDELEDMIKKCMRQVIGEQERTNKPPHDHGNQFLDVKEAAAYLKVAISTLYALSATRRITSIKSHKKVLFLKTDLEQWLLSSRRLSTDQIEEKLIREGKL